MGRSKTLCQVQQYDTHIDNASKRIREIDAILGDNKLLGAALKVQSKTEDILTEKKKILSSAEVVVGDHSLKIDQNQKKLYSGSVTNPKDLEDLQLESESLNKYLSVLEERQLEAILEMDEAENDFNNASSEVAVIKSKMESEYIELTTEKKDLDLSITETAAQKDSFLSSNDIPDLQTYLSLRKSSGGIAVTLMISSSCSSCGANIPSAIAQEARSPVKLAFCPTCNRILHPG
jgi:predicted  nucleic acid-binding Zn-ribbon protein